MLRFLVVCSRFFVTFCLSYTLMLFFVPDDHFFLLLGPLCHFWAVRCVQDNKQGVTECNKDHKTAIKSEVKGGKEQERAKNVKKE